jgi:beta-glucanase (GH16 family)
MDHQCIVSQPGGQALALAIRSGHTVFACLLLCLAGGLLGSPARTSPPTGYTLAWSDEFDGAVGSKPNAANWNYDLGGGGWGNNEMETYVSDAQHAQIISDPLALDSKALQIQATKDAQGHIYSARLLTQGKITAQYGYVEGRIQMCYGQGMWPAFWMLGTDYPTAGWPTCGEMDIMENIGSEPSTVHGTIHGPGYSGSNGIGASYTLSNSQQFKDDYHTFAVRWRPDAISWDVDGTTYETRTTADIPSGTTWAFNKPFFIVLNLAVGGYWPGYPDATTVYPQNLRVDYIRVYTFNPPIRHTVTLKSLANSKYVSAGPGGASSLIPSQTTPGATEQFQVIDAGSGAVALKCLANGKYVTAATGTSLVANSASLSSSALFLWVDAGSGNVALKALGNSRYVTAENGGASALIANRTAVSTWESFAVENVGPVDPGVLADAGSALGAAGGLMALVQADFARLNVEAGGTGVDIADAVRLVRRANGLDSF